MASNRSGVLGRDRPTGRLSCSLHGLSSSPFSHPGIVSDVPGRLSSGSSLAARGRGDACQRSLRNLPRSGSWLLQSSLPGGEGGWHPVIDLSHLNEFVQLTRFKMETVASVLLSVREGDFLASLELKDAYFQIPIHPSSRKLLRFTSEGTFTSSKPCVLGCRPLPRPSPGSSQLCQRGHTLTGSGFYGIWTTGWFLPLRSGKPNRPSSPFSRFVAPSGL